MSAGNQAARDQLFGAVDDWLELHRVLQTQEFTRTPDDHGLIMSIVDAAIAFRFSHSSDEEG